MDNNFNYCLKQWQNFTMLTDEEVLNLGKITQNKEYQRWKHYKYRVVETGKIYKSVTEVARALNISRRAVYNSFINNEGNLPKIGFKLERI